MSWSNVSDEFTIDDIGARLLANLARGIYNHEAVLREYVQNACDAYAALGTVPEHDAIHIGVEDNETIAVQDNGIGMDLADIKAAKRIAVSSKSELYGMTGFRGIGIWAGFQACNQLEVVSTKAGSKRRYRLQIDFADILEHVNEDINIKELLDGRFRIQADNAREDEHYTRVRLVGLQGDYRKLTERQELERIVSQVLPCKVDPQFEFINQLNEFYDNVDFYQEYPILVEGGEVFKQFPDKVEEFNVASLTRDGEEYGRVWWCSGRQSLPTRNFEHRSFRLRIRNFAVGGVGIYDDEDGSAYGIVNQLKLRTPSHLNWHVGEIHITNPDIRPDTPRSALELDALSRRTIEAIRQFYDDRIADSRALSEFNTCRRDLEKSEELLNSEDGLDVEEVQALLQRLKEQDVKIRNRQPADKVKKRLRELLRKREHMTKLRKQIALLEKQIPRTASAQQATQATDEQPANGRESASKTSTGPKTEEAQANEQPADTTDFQVVNFEELLSDVFATVKSKIGDEDELYTEVCQAIQAVFVSKGLVDA
jgi:hypothetical protein